MTEEQFIGHTPEEIKQFQEWNKSQRKKVMSEDEKIKQREAVRASMQKMKLCNPLDYKANWKYKNLLKKYKNDREGLALELNVYLRVVKKMRRHFLRRGINIES